MVSVVLASVDIVEESISVVESVDADDIKTFDESSTVDNETDSLVKSEVITDKMLLTSCNIVEGSVSVVETSDVDDNVVAVESKEEVLGKSTDVVEELSFGSVDIETTDNVLAESMNGVKVVEGLLKSVDVGTVSETVPGYSVAAEEELDLSNVTSAEHVAARKIPELQEKVSII